MLEEALTSPTYSPSEAALAMHSFVEVELPAGGASAEARFFRLFSLLCDRVFGPVSKAAQDEYKHAYGGWFSREVRWQRPRNHAASSNRYAHSPLSQPTNSMNDDPVIKLLGTAQHGPKDSIQQQLQTLIEAISKEAEHRPNVRYPFPFHALPKPTQQAWMALLEIALAGMTTDVSPSENATRLLGSLLKVRPHEQRQLRAYQQKRAQKKEQQRRPLQLSPGYNNKISNFSSNSSSMPSTPTTARDQSDDHPNIMLSMLEYYLMMFIRYPLAAPPPPPKQSTPLAPRNFGNASNFRRSDNYGMQVYQHLFHEYLAYFIPYNKPDGQFSGFDVLQRPSELFLRFTIEFWMQGLNCLDPTEVALQKLQQRQRLDTCDLSTCYDLLKFNYDPPVPTVRTSIKHLVARAVLDGALLDGARDWNVSASSWCLTPTMTTLQAPMFNYVRASFRRASIHASGSPFHAALEAWLIWLEPWNAKHRGLAQAATERILSSVGRNSDSKHKATPTMTYPRATHRSKYSPQWAPYIAANLHMYTEPLALFLRRARELDFSSREFKRSLIIVRRVFRIFTPEVVATLDELLASRQAHAKYGLLVKKHEDNLGCYCPMLSWNLSLKACQTVMHNLLEEAHLQHTKKVRDLGFIDRCEARLEGFFGQGVVSGEEKELKNLVAKARVIVGFPADYRVIRDESVQDFADRNITGQKETSMNHFKDGVLSDSARMRLLDGSMKYSPIDIEHTADYFYAPPQSHEIALLVPLLTSSSDYINSRLGLLQHTEKDTKVVQGSTPEKFIGTCMSQLGLGKINLRFLADYRWIIVIAFVLWVWRPFSP